MVFSVSDKATDLIERQRLMDLVLASARQDVSPNTIPRILVSREPVRLTGADVDELPDDNVSPLAVLVVLAMLMGLFVAIVQL
jgi:hypothetical protein